MRDKNHRAKAFMIAVVAATMFHRTLAALPDDPNAPEWQITVQVLDEDAIPVPDARVFVVHNLPSTPPVLASRSQKSGLTDSNGCITAMARSDQTVGYWAEKPGYYPAAKTNYTFENSLGGQWQPWNPKVKLVLKPYFIPAAKFTNNLFAPSKHYYSEPKEAAYVGDVVWLKAHLDSEKASSANSDKSKLFEEEGQLAQYAIIGRQTNVLDLLFANGYPNSTADVEAVFGDKDMTPDIAQTFISEIHDFKVKWGGTALKQAVQTESYGVAHALIAAGIKFDQADNATLLPPIRSRNFKLLQLLVNAGADPYAPIRGTRSMAEMAVQLKSASLLKLLDPQHRYAAILKQFQNELVPAADSPFIGTFAYKPEGGGFGSIGLVLNEDGTAIIGNDLGIGPAIWKTTNNEVTIKEVDEPVRQAGQHPLQFELVGNDLVAGSNDRVLKLTKILSDHPDSWSGRLYPPVVRFEFVCLSPDGLLCLQISGHCLAVPMQRLADAKTGNYGFTVTGDNVIRWSDFKRGQIPSDVIKDSEVIPFVNIEVNPQWSQRWNQAVTADRRPVATAPGYEFTLFPDGDKTSRYNGSGTGTYGQSVQGYILVSNKSLAPGRNWVVFYLLQSTVNPD